MAFSLPLISILMSWISYQTISAHPFGMFPGPGLGGMSGMGGGMPGMSGGFPKMGGGFPKMGGGFPKMGGGFPGMGSGSSGMGGSDGTAGDTSTGISSTSVKTELSESCKKAATALSEGEIATCANIPALLALPKVEGSIVPAINTWVTGACSAVPCTQEALNTAAEKFKKECQKDMEDGSAPAIGIYSHLLHYKEARNTFCTQSKSDSKFCIPSVMAALEEKAGVKITNAGLKAAMSGKYTKDSIAFIRVPKETYCTPCSHALVTQAAIMVEAMSNDPKIKFKHSSAPQMAKVSQICGESFEDRKIPESVQIAAPGTGKAEAGGAKDQADMSSKLQETEAAPEKAPKEAGAKGKADASPKPEAGPEKKPKDSGPPAEKPMDAGADAEKPKDGPTPPTST
ncbi:hypothetical protein PGTUg99_002561 [Puccinia graminis f. sp. tritici]|uniref:Uncharacterized protein n=1 Tax=Puccinia graminis f. sp. tritici TaxID=56615 RepID=A0A5B0SG21_PUCGR|nr:hypothetical protein PGTUg99_002561 [Puccinia graminis f. sp. tritici]